MIIGIVLLILAIPVGFLISYLARDELIAGRKWFQTICLLGILLFLIFYFAERKDMAFTSLFISVVSLISYWKSYDKKLTKKRI